MNMKVRRIFTLLIVALVALAANANLDGTRFVDIDRDQTITVTIINPYILKVDVKPNSWNGERLPSLVRKEITDLKVAMLDQEQYVMRTSSGMKTFYDEDLHSLTISCGKTFFITDLCDRTLHGTLRLLHTGKESFYGAGERGYSLNLAGDTLINYNKQNYGYVSGETRIKQMGITMPFIISSKGYGILFDDFCKSSLYIGEEGIEYKTTSPQRQWQGGERGEELHLACRPSRTATAVDVGIYHL